MNILAVNMNETCTLLCALYSTYWIKSIFIRLISYKLQSQDQIDAHVGQGQVNLCS